MTPPALEQIPLVSGFPAQVVHFAHDLHNDPRMELEAIAGLAERMPDAVVFDSHDKGLLVPHGGPPKGKLQEPGDVVRHLDTNTSWLTLLNVEDDPDYAILMNTELDRVERGMRERHEQMCERAAFIILGSPSSVTPVHFDIECSMLMQVSGRKRVTIGRWESESDRRHEIERYFDGSHGRMESVPPEFEQIELEPGTGVFIPPNEPHWVHNHDNTSVSITLTFFTSRTLRNSRIEDLNSHLRNRFHLHPRPPGTSAISDAAKTAVIGAVRMGKHVRSGMAAATARHEGSRRY